MVWVVARVEDSLVIHNRCWNSHALLYYLDYTYLSKRALAKVMLPPIKEKLPHNIIIKVYKYTKYRLFHVTHLRLLIYFHLIFSHCNVLFCKESEDEW